MATMTYDDRSFILDGKRIWLASGTIHYFRFPRALWKEHLLKAKRAGLNCIETYVAWNFHEMREGEWNFEGDRDIAAFIRQAKELGLYVILRPGPYICAEWDFGGFPGWLACKSGIAYRTNNAVYTHYFDKYFRQVLGRLADLQVTRGGNIILIQNENEYSNTTMPDRLVYLEFITQLIRRSGFDIPIINCNLFSDPPVPDTIECMNGWGDEIQQLKRMSLRQPAAPLMFTEFWSGWFDGWGGQHSRKDAGETARRALEILGCGGQTNYYTFDGGTNFAFWGCRLDGGMAAWQTTSYDFDAPVAEGGGLTRKYYLTRLVNMLANHMGRFLATCFMEEPPVTVHDSTCVLNLSGTSGRWAVVTNNGRADITTARLSLPDGRGLTVSLQPFGATAIPVDLAISDSITLDYCNVMPLGLFGQNILVLHGPENWPAVVCVNDKKIEVAIPADDEPMIVDHEGLKLVFVNTELAMRTWALDDSLLIGPGYVGENAEAVKPAAGAKQYAVLSYEGVLTHKKIAKPEPAAKPTVGPKLTAWKRISVCREPVDPSMSWQPIPGPRDVDTLGVHYGYCWYQAKVESAKAARRNIFMPECADRATVYLNGELVGTWGGGQGATLDGLKASFRKGSNVLTMLVDNMGRQKYGPRIGELKGLFGDVYDAVPVKAAFKLRKEETFNKRLVPRQFAHVMANLEKMQVWTAEATLSVGKVAPTHFAFGEINHPAAVICNERCVAFFPEGRGNFGDVMLASSMKKGKNVLRLILWGDVQPDVAKTFRLNALESLTQGAKWSFKPWDLPQEGGHVVGKDAPAWYAAHFKYEPAGQPLFLHIIGAKKGQVFVNGHNAGRFWTIGPQQHYYLPECWLRETNELTIFEEAGLIPANSRLEFRPLGPFQD